VAARRPHSEGTRRRSDAARPAVDDGPKHATKQRLIDAGLAMLLQHGYNDLGIAAVLSETNVPKGSFYHHFHDKEDFALQVIDQYMRAVHAGLDACLGDRSHPPLERVRLFFEATRQSYRSEGYLGCLLGGLGQELSGVNDVFRQKIDWCFSQIADRLAACLAEAQRAGDVPAQANPREMANRLVDCWEGAALRSRLRRDPAPLDAMLDFYFDTVGGSPAPRSVGSVGTPERGRRAAHGRARSS